MCAQQMGRAPPHHHLHGHRAAATTPSPLQTGPQEGPDPSQGFVNRAKRAMAGTQSSDATEQSERSAGGRASPGCQPARPGWSLGTRVSGGLLPTVPGANDRGSLCLNSWPKSCGLGATPASLLGAWDLGWGQAKGTARTSPQKTPWAPHLPQASQWPALPRVPARGGLSEARTRSPVGSSLADPALHPSPGINVCPTVSVTLGLGWASSEQSLNLRRRWSGDPDAAS